MIAPVVATSDSAATRSRIPARSFGTATAGVWPDSMSITSVARAVLDQRGLHRARLDPVAHGPHERPRQRVRHADPRDGLFHVVEGVERRRRLGVDGAHTFDRRVGLEHATRELFSHRAEPRRQERSRIRSHGGNHRVTGLGAQARRRRPGDGPARRGGPPAPAARCRRPSGPRARVVRPLRRRRPRPGSRPRRRA